VLFFESPEKDIKWMAAEKGKDLFLVFRGSDSFKDWIFNFWSAKVIPYGNKETKIRLHKGFYERYYENLRGDVHGRISRFEYETVHVIGYSFGGAMAQLCAVDVQYNFSKVKVECITFGSPRIGNEHFIKSYIKRVPNTRNYVYGPDIVPRLPPKLFGYSDYFGYNDFFCYYLGKRKFFPSIKDRNLNLYKQTSVV
jgi:predicted lipase